MQTFLYNIVALISRVHSYILTLNDQSENSFTDKELHFIVIGCLGIALILVLISNKISKKVSGAGIL